MLIASDLLPLRGTGRYRHAGESIDEHAALRLVEEGGEVYPADLDTCEAVAAKVEASGNDVRAAMFRRWAATAFGGTCPEQVSGKQLDAIRREIMDTDPVTVPDAVSPSVLPPAPAHESHPPSAAPPKSLSPAPPPAPKSRPPESPGDAAAAAKREVDEAGDDRAKLMRLASRAGVEVFGFQKVDRIRKAILDGIAVRVAQGKPPLQD